MSKYLAVTHIQNPLTGYPEPRVMNVYPATLFQEIVEWHRRQWEGVSDVKIHDLAIVEASDD